MPLGERGCLHSVQDQTCAVHLLVRALHQQVPGSQHRQDSPLSCGNHALPSGKKMHKYQRDSPGMESGSHVMVTDWSAGKTDLLKAWTGLPGLGLNLCQVPGAGPSASNDAFFHMVFTVAC